MKRIVLILISSLALFSCCGCGSNSTTNMSEAGDNGSEIYSTVSPEVHNKKASSEFYENDISGSEASNGGAENQEEVLLLDSHSDEKGEILSSGNCGAEGDNVQYQLYDNGNLYIFGSGDMKIFNNTPLFEEYSSDIIRVRIESGVTSIGQKIFSGCSEIKEAVMPEGITIIRKEAFYGCSGLQSIELPDSVTDIADMAFYECSSLESVKLSGNLKSVSYECFARCSALKNIEIPESVNSIGGSAFSDCSSITALNIPNNVTQIQDFTFWNCSSIEKLTIPSGVTDVGNDAFVGCTGMKNIVFLGDKPTFHSETIFSDYVNEPGIAYGDMLKLKIHYPSGNSTWSSVLSEMKDGKFKGAEVDFIED